jgi:hypothetical protein
MGDTVITIEVNSAASLKKMSFLVPPWEALVTAALNALAASAEDVNMNLHGTICIPPLLAEAEMNGASKTPTDLAMAFVTVMATHDGLMGAPETADKAMHHLQYAVQFCWAAPKKWCRSSIIILVLRPPRLLIGKSQCTKAGLC